MWCAGIKKNEDFQVIKEHSSHKNRLLDVKPRVDSNPPKEITHLKYKLKPKALKKDQVFSIQAENHLLLQKMMEISSRTPQSKKILKNKSLKSLNECSRVQQLAKISEENFQMLNRLQGIKSSYSFKKWNKDFRFKRYLSQKLSENSRRVPRVSNLAVSPSFDSTRSPFSRPETAVPVRPTSSGGHRPNINYLDL